MKAEILTIGDEVLRGERGWRLVSVNNLGRQMGETRVEREPSHGHELKLTIDMKLQAALMEAMEDEVGAGIFLDPPKASFGSVAPGEEQVIEVTVSNAGEEEEQDS